METFQLVKGRLPLLVSMPHTGTNLPEDIRACMTPEGQEVPDTDWHIDRLYDFARTVGASVLTPLYSRYVVDLNRPADDRDLYPGQVKTGLCPVETFSGAKIYLPGMEPDQAEHRRRVDTYWTPYHDALQQELARLKKEHGYAVLYDAHSIRSEVPRLFKGRLPDLNLGTNNGQSCADSIAWEALKAATESGYSSILNARFVGGYITRHYGDPDNNIHAIQMELAQVNYMDENSPFTYDAAKARPLQKALAAVLKAITEQAASLS